MNAVHEPGALAEFDPFSQAFRSDPIAWHPTLLNNSPGFMTMDGIPSAYVATFAHTQAVLRDPARFSSVKPPNLPGMQRVDFFNSQPVMNYSDDPDHARRRKIVAPAFSPGRVRDLAETVTGLSDELLAPIQPGQRVDIFNQICMPFGARLMLGQFMNVAPEDQKIFMEYGATLPLLDKLQPGDPKPKAYVDAWEKGRLYCLNAVAEARRIQAKTLMGVIADAEAEGSLSADEMMAMMAVLFTGGFPTIAATTASALYNLAAHPDVAARIRQDPALANKHVEECLRLDAPVTLVMRFATEDVEIGGKVIRKGMPVYTMLSVADRDPVEYAEPNIYNIDRANLRHLSFGFGIHVCIGNTVARLAVPIIVTAMAKRFPNLRPDPSAPVEWDTTPRSRHMKSATLLT